MNSSISPLEDAQTFSFRGLGCLYRDHRGRRVIVDVEGSGQLQIVTAETPLIHVRGEETFNSFGSDFHDGAVVLAAEQGDVTIQVIKGRSTAVHGTETAVERINQGTGWVVQASGPFTVDDRHEAGPTPSRGFAVPFFRSVSSSTPFVVVPDDAITCEKVDTLDISDLEDLDRHRFKVQNMSALFDLESTFADGTCRSGVVASHLNSASFRISIPQENVGLILRKLFDSFHGRQRARVFVDGVFAGWWYEPREDRICRWHVSDFGVARELTNGRPEVTITIEPPAGVPLWSVSRLETYALLQSRVHEIVPSSVSCSHEPLG